MNTQNYVCTLLALVLISFIGCTQKKEELPVYKQPTATVEERVTDLLARMSVEEKILQLNQYILGINTNINNIGEEVADYPAELGSVIYFAADNALRNELQRKAMENSRLGIPVLFGFDVIHGFRTIFPIPLGQACSWNPELVKQVCQVAAQESRMSGVDWTFSPMIDVARDGRWGRIAEGYGEDPFTNGVFAVASVQGYQGDDLAGPVNVAACLKHFVGYGVSEGGRDYTATDISRQTLWDTYLPPYEAGIKAGAATVMSAFNDISGVPATCNRYILTEILKEHWGHDGFVVSDWNAVQQLVSQGVAADRKEAALRALASGLDMNMKDDCYREHLPVLLEEGKITMKQIDESVARILRLKFRLGLFEQPYTPDYKEEERVLLPGSRELAAQAAAESMVLLKNESDLLPLAKNSKIAVVGPLAKDSIHLLGSWKAHGQASDVETLYEGMEKEFGNKALLYAYGCDFEGDNTSGFVEAVRVARQADVVVVCIGEKREWSGENASRSTLALPAIQERLVKELQQTGKPLVLVLSGGRPLELCRLEPMACSMLAIWQPGIAGGTPLAGILSGRINPSGKLAVTFPLTTGQIPVYYNARQSSRPDQGQYQDISTRPLYEFGHGLSYTRFEYGELKISAPSFRRGEKLVAEIPVTNAGRYEGMETVHWFISDPYCSITRPVKELKHFEKRLLKPGETTVFRFEIDPQRDLGFVNDTGERFLEEGDYYIIVKDKKVKVELVK